MRPGRRTPAAFLAFMTPHDGSGMIIIRHALVTRRDGFAVPALPLATSPIESILEDADGNRSCVCTAVGR